MREMRSENDKVAIVTLFHGNYNFGGLLQAYALPVALEKYLEIAAEQIDYAWCYEKEKEQKEKRAVSLRKLLYLFGIRFFSRLEKRHLKQRIHVFDRFMDDIPHSRETYYSDSVSDVLGKYTAFICGGDQIWNEQQLKGMRKEDEKVFTLQFVPEPIKKVSYAPSMAVLDLTDEFKAEFSAGINRLDAISIREERSVPVLEELTQKPITVVVDPVLLLQEEEWLEATNPAEKPQRYVLCYLLGDNVTQRRAVQRFAKKTHRPIVTFPHILGNVVRKCDLFFGDVYDYSSGPREFLDLIRHADLVVTDSFHACVFSMIFKTPFAVFERSKAGETGNMNSRIYDFLEEYHLERQLVTEKELEDIKDIPKVDFTYAHEHWQERRRESLAYLENALMIDRNGAEL